MWSNPGFHSYYICVSLLTIIKVTHLMRLLSIWLGMDYGSMGNMQLWVFFLLLLFCFVQYEKRKKMPKRSCSAEK